MDALFRGKKLRVVVVGRNLSDLMPMLAEFPVEVVEQSPDLVISYGGDGSLLGAEQRFPLVPKFPLRDFRQNPKCVMHDEKTVLHRLFAGELECTLLPRIHVRLAQGGELAGLNDVVIRNEVVSSAIRYRIWVNGKVFRSQIVADSLVVSTPFGSTGYFRSITRGVFLDGLGLVFTNSMDLESFAVVPEKAQIEVELLRGPAEIVADNNPKTYQLENGARISIGIRDEHTPVYGIDVFRCEECYNLRRNGVTKIS